MVTRNTAVRVPVEITARGLCLGALITAVFMAANIYMGLKTGMTFSSSIPAAMISMGCLRLIGGAGIHENNIVQTQASAAGTLCNVILILPGLVLIGHWHHFPFWQTAAVCALGGLLGIAFSIPLRRTLVVGAGLPYPEGVAAAEVLRAGQGEAGREGLRSLLGAAGTAGTIGLATNGFKLLAEGVHGTLVLGAAVFHLGTGFSLALIGVGYLVGIGACLALLTGVALAWGIAVPTLTALGHASGVTGAEAAEVVWSGQVRLIGAGIIAVGGLWTVGTLLLPILAGIQAALASVRRRTSGLSSQDQPLSERDLPITWIGAAALALAFALAWLFGTFAFDANLGRLFLALVAAATLFALIFGFLMSAVCGYLAGLLGSSSSPISGIGILTTMAAALLLPMLLGHAVGSEGERFLIAMVLILASVIVTMASIANDNLQDLKTGQLVGATPWRQQVALIVGVLVGAMVIAPLLSVLYEAYGFVGAMPRVGMEASDAMPAPQASLTSLIASGIIKGSLPWTTVLIGASLGAVLVVLEAQLKRRGLTFPTLTVGIGMYLPLSVAMTIAVGGVLGWLAEMSLRRRGQTYRDEKESAVREARRKGVLLSSGFLVGESLAGVVLAGFDVTMEHSVPLALAVPGFAPFATWLGLFVFMIGILVFYLFVSNVARI